MTLTLMLLRHAKAKRPEDGVDDFDRKLSRRGREAATELGSLLRAEGLAPDFALVSAAKRTRQTWERVAAELGAEVAERETRAALPLRDRRRSWKRCTARRRQRAASWWSATIPALRASSSG
nr:hypothetical protein [uncultured bacterium]